MPKKENIYKFVKNNKVIASLTIAIAVIILRRPDAIINAQFWAEDGVVWFAEAYNEGGLKSLLEPQNGYYQTISKLTAWISLAFSLKFAPIIFNSLAIIIRALPIALLWSNRFSIIIPSDKLKIIISITYLCLPTISEVHSNITNAHWHLALYAFMIVISLPVTSIYGKVNDILFTLIAGLSGPFSIILTPIIIIFWWFKRKVVSSFFYILALITLFSAGIQLWAVIFTSDNTRSHASLGASVELFIRLISGKLFGVLLFGEKFVNNIAKSLWLALPIFILSMSIIIIALWKANLELKLLILFSTLLISAAFSSPMISTTDPQWPLMTNASTGARYFFIPLVAWSTTLVWFLSQMKNKKIKIILATVFGLLMINVFISDFKLKAYKDKEFYKHAEIFSSLPSGTEYKIPINPGKGWDVILIKK